MADPDLARRIDEAIRSRDADPDRSTRTAMDAVIRRADSTELADLLDSHLEFGTVGIRGPLGPGPNRMNRLVVRQTAAGLARVLVAQAPPSLDEVGVIVGHDARHGSPEFATDVAIVLASHGIPVHAVDEPAPTPFVAFALGHLGAAAAVVVTASHNPPTDNGIKVYWSDGAQIVAPIDGLIESAIDDVRADGEILGPREAQPAAIRSLGGPTSDDPVVLVYVAAALALSPGRPPNPVPLAVTSLHGVGAALVERVLGAAGHGPLHAVADQREPDPDFPTVAFPNPEEPGALDELLALAAAEGCALALANDPDADRLALAAPTHGDEWRALTGDETGALLAAHLLRRTDGITDRLLATTVVSSRLVGRIADDAGAHFVETLTGFKWLCRPGIEHPEWHQVLLYEEALGYAIGPSTRDKDGITAALVAADLAAELTAAGRTVWDELDDLARAHGAHVTRNGSIRVDATQATRMIATIERWGSDPPPGLAGSPLERVDVPAHDVVRLFLADRTRIVVRPSGTEPKVKYYCEAVEPVVDGAGDGVESARIRCRQRLDRIVPELERLLTT